MPNTIHESENQLFELWGSKLHSFVSDGVIDEQAYSAAPMQLLFLLKEANDPEQGTWDLREVLSKESLSQTWSNVARWAYGLLQDGSFPSFIQLPAQIDQEFRNAWIRNIAVVNMKKTGGGSSTNSMGLGEFVRSNCAELQEQLMFYKPHITVCCGTGDLLNDVNGPIDIGPWRMASNGVGYTRSKILGLVINYYHPQAHFPANFLYTMLIEAVRELAPADRYKV